MINDKLARLARLLAVLPVIILTTMVNVVIAAVMAIVVFMQLWSALGCGKTTSIVVSVLVAIAIHLYIAFQPQIKHYINSRS